MDSKDDVDQSEREGGPFCSGGPLGPSHHTGKGYSCMIWVRMKHPERI